MDVDDHIRVFNAAVLSQDWSAFVARFTDDAVVEFVGVPAGPYVGRDAIAAAYQQSPPDDTIESAGAPSIEAGELVVPYRWVDLRRDRHDALHRARREDPTTGHHVRHHLTHRADDLP